MSRFRGLGALCRAYLIETWRSKPAIFWNLAFPLVVLIGLAFMFGGGNPDRVTYMIPGILTINVIAASFFGVSLYMVSLRQSELYRRFRATPLSPLAVVLAHSATALVNISISVLLQLAVARALFRIHIQGSVPEVALALLLALFAFIPLGLLVGCVAADMKTAPAISNLLFFPMMFLSGAAMPLFLMPGWLQRVAALLPATYAIEVLQAAIVRGDLLDGLAVPACLLLLTGVLALAFDARLFRWESRVPMDRRGLALALASLAALYLVAFAGGVELRSAQKPEGLPEEGTQSSSQTTGPGVLVLRGMTILDGSGRRIERGQVVLEQGRIVEVGSADGPPPEGASMTDLSGLYLIPGLIDSHVHLGGSAGGSVSSGEFLPARIIHDLQAYLALGVTSVVSLTDDLDDMKGLRDAVAAGTMRAPRPYFSGPGLTAPGGHPAKFFVIVPGLAARMTRQVETEEQAVAAVRELAEKKVDLVKLFLEGGWIGDPVPELPEPALRAAIRTAHELGLRTTVHVDNDRHARMAIDAGADGIEHVPPDLSPETAARMAARGVTLTPTLAAYEGLAASVQGERPTDPLALDWVAPNVLDSLRSPDSWIAEVRRKPEAVAYYRERHTKALAAVRRAVEAGVPIVAGSDAGNPASFHGPGLIRELELLVEAGGMTPGGALAAATGEAAKRLKSQEIGRIAPGALADLVVLGADPARDIRALRDVRAVYFRGEPLQRDTLLSTPPGSWMPGPADRP